MPDHAVKEFRKLNLQQRVYALCLTVFERVTVDVILDVLKYVEGRELSEQEVHQITHLFEEMKKRVRWGDKSNEQIVETELGISPKTVHGVIAESALSKMKTDERIVDENRTGFL